MSADVSLHRDPVKLAEAFAKDLTDRPTRNARSLACESEHESVLVAYEMRKLGWKAEETELFINPMGDMKEAFGVRVTGKKRSKP